MAGRETRQDTRAPKVRRDLPSGWERRENKITERYCEWALEPSMPTERLGGVP